MCTVAKQVPSLRWWVAWGLTDCAQAPPPAAGASPGLGAAPRGVSHPSPCVSRRPELSFETHPLQCLLSSFWCQAGFVW